MLAVRHGGPDAGDVTVDDVPRPHPGDGEVLVRVEAAGLNPFDLLLTTARPTGPLPHVPGRDVAGTVVGGPTGTVGQEIWATGGDLGSARDGTHAEYVVLPAAAVRPRPAALSALQAGVAGVAFTTAWHCLSAVGVRPGDRVLVTGAAGAVGSAAVQIARWQGASQVWGLVRAEQDEAAVRDAGADIAVSSPGRLAALLDRTRAARPTACVDTVGGPVLAQVLPALAPQARTVCLSTPGDGRIDLDLRSFYRSEQLLTGVNSGRYDSVDGGRVLKILAPGFESGALRTRLPVVAHPLRDATAAYELLARRAPGKIVLV